MRPSIMDIDFFARKAVWSLWRFRGIDTGVDSCSGHLEYGSRNSSNYIIQYIPGLKKTGYDEWEFEGKPVGLETFLSSSFICRDLLIIRPLEAVHAATINREDLHWKGFYLYFTEFDTEHPETKELEGQLQMIFSKYRNVLDLGFNENNSFYGHGITGHNHSVEELVERQNTAISFWKDIETACKGTFMEYGILE